jgi:hypothetical protein
LSPDESAGSNLGRLVVLTLVLLLVLVFAMRMID